MISAVSCLVRDQGASRRSHARPAEELVHDGLGETVAFGYGESLPDQGGCLG